MTEKKITKKEKYGMLLAIEEVAADDMLRTFVEEEIAALEAKAEKARERAAKKKAENDELGEKIYNIIVEKGSSVTLQELYKILSVDDEEITTSKIVARLTKLVNSDKIDKAEATIEKSKKMTYFVKEAE
jgi:hypothetical protein